MCLRIKRCFLVFQPVSARLEALGNVVEFRLVDRVELDLVKVAQ